MMKNETAARIGALIETTYDFARETFGVVEETFGRACYTIKFMPKSQTYMQTVGARLVNAQPSEELTIRSYISPTEGKTILTAEGYAGVITTPLAKDNAPPKPPKNYCAPLKPCRRLLLDAAEVWALDKGSLTELEFVSKSDMKRRMKDCVWGEHEFDIGGIGWSLYYEPETDLLYAVGIDDKTNAARISTHRYTHKRRA